MTEIELMNKIIDVGTHFTLMNHTCHLSFERYKHIKDNDFEENEIAYEVSCSVIHNQSSICKTLKAALIETLNKLKKKIADRIKDLESNEKELQHWKKIHEML